MQELGHWTSCGMLKDDKVWSVGGKEDLPMKIRGAEVLLQDSRYDERTKDLAKGMRF